MNSKQTPPQKADDWKFEPLSAAMNAPTMDATGLGTPELLHLLSVACQRITVLEMRLNELEAGTLTDLAFSTA